jgi:serine/threonine protein kinase
MFGVAGTMVYMAPEILLRIGYQSSIDYWSLGVIMFELLFGTRPFRGRNHDDLVDNILTQDILATIPANDFDQDLIDCLTGVFTRGSNPR